MNVDQGKGRRGTVGQVAYFQADARPPAPLPAAGHNARQQKPLWGKGPVRLFTGRLRFGAALAAASVRMPLAAAAGDSRGCRSSRADDLHRGNAWHGIGRTGNRRDGNSAPGPSFLRDAYILSCGFPPIESGCSRFEHMQRKASGCM